MHLGKVIGSVVASVKYPGMEGWKLLVVQPLDHALEKAGQPLVAIDLVQAGENDLVDYTLGGEASLAMRRPDLPVDAAITGIVDAINTEAV